MSENKLVDQLPVNELGAVQRGDTLGFIRDIRTRMHLGLREALDAYDQARAELKLPAREMLAVRQPPPDVATLFKPPFRYDATGGYIFDANNEMVADNRAYEGKPASEDEDAPVATLRVRGWGYLTHRVDDPKKAQDDLGNLIARVLTEGWPR